eukprot:scaffold116362_cov66-Phaeocystis_antarctica.AAC.1
MWQRLQPYVFEAGRGGAAPQVWQRVRQVRQQHAPRAQGGRRQAHHTDAAPQLDATLAAHELRVPHEVPAQPLASLPDLHRVVARQRRCEAQRQVARAARHPAHRQGWRGGRVGVGERGACDRRDLELRAACAASAPEEVAAARHGGERGGRRHGALKFDRRPPRRRAKVWAREPAKPE